MVSFIKFSNFYSFKDEVILNFESENLKTKSTKFLRNNIFTLDESHSLKKSLVLFGSNGFGKTNIFKTLIYCKNLILNLNFLQQNPVPVFKNLMGNKVSSFLIGFNIDELHYEYSFSILNNTIVEESLYYIPNKNKNKIFQRKNNHISFTNFFSNSKLKILAGFVPENQLFLTFLSQISLDNFTDEEREKISILTNCYDFFKFNFITPFKKEISTEHIDLIDEYKDLIIELLNFADFKISDIVLKLDDNKVKLLIEHQEFLSSPVDFDTEESSGFKNIFYFMINLISSYNSDSLFLCDNFASDINPVNARYLIDIIHCLDRIQCLLSSNCTSLMDTNLLRLDQIGFISKNEFGKSSLSYLLDYKTFRDTMNCEKCYLQGRFDGVPYIMASNKNIRDLISDYL